MVNMWIDIRQACQLKGYCLICSERAQTHRNLCDHCANRIEFIQHPCSQCGEPLTTQTASRQCGRCQRHPPAFDYCRAPMLYNESLKALHLKFKFHQNLAAGELLANLLSDHLCRQQRCLPQLLIPVPLHATRMRQRGFDQALEIAKVLAKRLQIPLHTGLLTRNLDTPAQSGLNRIQRQTNLRNAFKLTDEISALKHIALIDDIMTTGSTFNAAARPCKSFGVETVEVWAVGRSVRDA